MTMMMMMMTMGVINRRRRRMTMMMMMMMTMGMIKRRRRRRMTMMMMMMMMMTMGIIKRRRRRMTMTMMMMMIMRPFTSFPQSSSCSLALTLGTNNRRRVKVAITLNDEPNNAYLALTFLCPATKDRDPVITVMITTLYTLIPIYLESFREGEFTFLVSQARKSPITNRRPFQIAQKVNHKRW